MVYVEFEVAGVHIRQTNCSQHLPLACAQTGIDLKLFNFLSESKNESHTTEELADQLGADPGLLSKYCSLRTPLEQVT